MGIEAEQQRSMLQATDGDPEGVAGDHLHRIPQQFSQNGAADQQPRLKPTQVLVSRATPAP
jgi:hypothetical protein